MAVARAHEAQAVAAVEGVAQGGAGDGVVDEAWGVAGLGIAVHAGHLGQGLEDWIGRDVPVGGHGAAGLVVGQGEGVLAPEAGPELLGVGAVGAGGVADRALVAEEEDVAVAVDPAGPLVAEQGHEAAGLVEGAGLGLDLLPQRGRLHEGLQAPAVVVGQGDDVEGGDVAGVAEVVGWRACAVRDGGVAVEIAPEDARLVGAHHGRVGLGAQAAGGGEAEAEDAVGGGGDGGVGASAWAQRGGLQLG